MPRWRPSRIECMSSGDVVPVRGAACSMNSAGSGGQQQRQQQHKASGCGSRRRRRRRLTLGGSCYWATSGPRGAPRWWRQQLEPAAQAAEQRCDAAPRP